MYMAIMEARIMYTLYVPTFTYFEAIIIHLISQSVAMLFLEYWKSHRLSHTHTLNSRIRKKNVNNKIRITPPITTHRCSISESKKNVFFLTLIAAHCSVLTC